MKNTINHFFGVVVLSGIASLSHAQNLPDDAIIVAGPVTQNQMNPPNKLSEAGRKELVNEQLERAAVLEEALIPMFTISFQQAQFAREKQVSGKACEFVRSNEFNDYANISKESYKDTMDEQFRLKLKTRIVADQRIQGFNIIADFIDANFNIVKEVCDQKYPIKGKAAPKVLAP